MTFRLRTMHFARLASAMSIAAVFCTPVWAVNDPISTWTFEAGTTGNPPGGVDCGTSGNPACPIGTDISGISPETGPGTALGHHTSASTVWSNPAGNGTLEAFSSNNFAVGDYYQFKSSTSGNLFDIGLILDQTSSGTGPRDWKVQYSTDGTGFLDSGVTYSIPGNSWNSATYNPADTHAIDLRSIPALNNKADVYFRLVVNSGTAVNGSPIGTGGTSRLDDVMVVSNFVPPEPPPPPPDPRLPQVRDVVFGLNNSSATNTFLLVNQNGSPTMSGGVPAGSPWQSDPFMQSVRFDNKGGILHNVNGNLLAVDFGSAANGGAIHSLATQGSIPLPTGQVIGNTRAVPDNSGQAGGLTLARLGGLSVSPDNMKIAVTGYESGSVIVYDYTAGDSLGANASLADGRQTPTDSGNRILAVSSTQGTAWLDNDTVLAFNTLGDLYEVDAGSMATELKTSVNPSPIGSDFTSLAYNPDVSPYVYAMYSGFASVPSPTTKTLLFVLNPASNYNLVHQVDLSTSLPDSGREIALDKDGNLFISSRGSSISFLANPNSAADNTSVLWYQSSTFSSFNGIDIAFGSASLTGDYNGDGKVDAADYVVWRNDPGAFGGDQGYTDWKANFGKSLGSGSAVGSTAAVPEPMGLTLLLVGIVGLWQTRRRA